jgi:5-methyltetrahydropteroyltriglutamate--homocysteine methyltransferase
VKSADFNKAHTLARKAIREGKDIRKDEFLLANFYRVVATSFRRKIEAGLDVVNYPQHHDIYGQFLEPLHEAMDKGTYVVEEKEAVIPEVHVVNEEAKSLYEETGRRVALRVCVTGPLELYLTEVGTTPYKEVLMMFSETVKRFARNAILDSKYVKTEVVSLDEPSFGFQEISADSNSIIEVLEEAFDFTGAVKQVHLHSPSRLADVLHVRNVDVLSFEYAASPKNIESLSKKMLDKADKQIRVGIARTDFDSMMAELRDKGITQPDLEQLVESEEIIQKRFVVAKEKYGDRLTFTGPDCGLGGWPTPEAAQLLLKRTVNAVKNARASL